jgi:uncharacterized phage infection (PIP) family protein YhgE
MKLQKELETAPGGRAAAEKESYAAKSKLNDANNRIAGVTEERDAMQRERDQAVNQLKVAKEAQNHVQILVAENSNVKQKLPGAEKEESDMAEDKPKAQELAEMKKQLDSGALPPAKQNQIE